MPLRLAPSLVLLLATLGSVDASDWQAYAPGDHVVVKTRNGRTLRGQIDRRTDAAAVWLSESSDGVTITSRTEGIDVESVHPGVAAPLPPTWSSIATATPVEQTPTASFASDAPQPTVRSLAVQAEPASWDADTAADGLSVWVQPLDAWGNVTPVAGSVRVELLLEGEHGRTGRGFEVAETWRRPIDANRFSQQGTLLRLPLRHVQPEAATDAFPMAILRVRLIVPGQGAFDALITDLPLRPYSWNRDRQQLRSGERRLPGESR